MEGQYLQREAQVVLILVMVAVMVVAVVQVEELIPMEAAVAVAAVLEGTLALVVEAVV